MFTTSTSFAPSTLSLHNKDTLEELVGAIALGQGADEITLLIVRCNYASLREAMLADLQRQLAAEGLQGRVHTLRFDAVLQQSPQLTGADIFNQVQTIMEYGRPGAVMLVGLESYPSKKQLFADLNPWREELRRTFHFPMVMWLTDMEYGHLCQFANDLESISGGTTLRFTPAADQLQQWLQDAAKDMFEALLQRNRADSFNTRLNDWNSGPLQQHELAIALSDLRHQNYAIHPDLLASVTFAQGLERCAEDADALFGQCATYWEYHPEAVDALLKRGLALFYLGRARYFAADNAKHQELNWMAIVAPLEECLVVLEECDRPDLISLCSIQLQQVLHRLEQWDKLDQLLQQVHPLHQTYSNATTLAQDYGFWADIALHRQQWQQAADLAQQAIDTLAKDTEQDSGKSWWRILYLKMLAQAETALGNIESATQHLRLAQTMGVMEHPKLHSDILCLLQQRLRDQGCYLEAFEIKQERLAVEKQYGLRAFIGAGRLRSQRVEQRLTVCSERQTIEDIAPEIAASGRFQDLTELLSRIAGKIHKFIVIHGTSGVGKSSLVTGGLIPALQARALNNRTNVPILIRHYTNWQEELAGALDKAWPGFSKVKVTSQNSPEKVIGLRLRSDLNCLPTQPNTLHPPSLQPPNHQPPHYPGTLRRVSSPSSSYL